MQRMRTTIAIVGIVSIGLALAAPAQVPNGTGSADDPNLPGAGQTQVAGYTGNVSWSRVDRTPVNWQNIGDPDRPNIPNVLLPPLGNGGPGGAADYLGFVDGEGSLLQAYADKGAIYVFNASAHTLTRKYDKLDDIPSTVLAALKNRKYVYTSRKDPLNVLTDVDVGTSSAAAQRIIAKPYEPDPNMPETTSDAQAAYPLSWQQNGVSITIKSAQYGSIPGMYLGFNERGTWIANPALQVLVWNLNSKTLTQVADSWWEAPLDLRNPSAFLQALLYYKQHLYQASAGSRQAPDPNFPPMLGWFSGSFLAMRWQYETPDATTPLVFLGAGMPDRYLGFDERGGWVLGNDRGIYVWSFKTWKIQRVASSLDNVPVDALRRLHSPDPLVTHAIAAGASTHE